MITYTVNKLGEFKTIQSAIKAASVYLHGGVFTESVTVSIESGTYKEMVEISEMAQVYLKPTAEFSLIIKNADGCSPVIDGEGVRRYCIAISDTSNVLINGIGFMGYTIQAVVRV
jgi:pectin methylesterase-like acyl-CoA thioesterase